MATSNIINDIKKAIKRTIEEKLSPVGVATAGKPGRGLGPKGKKVTVIISDNLQAGLAESVQDMPLIVIQLTGDTPDLTRGQVGQSRIFYREPDLSIPGVEKQVVDESGTLRTGPDFKDRYIRPQPWVFRFEIQTVSVQMDELQEVHCQLQSLFEGQRTSYLTVTRNDEDASEYEEKFRMRSMGGRIVSWENGSKSIIQLDCYAYHDVAQQPVRERTIQGYDWNIQADNS